jgi:hypothetical protein
MGVTGLRGASLLLALFVSLASATVRAEGRRLEPSPRALAATAGDEPPPYVDPATLRQPPPTKVVTTPEREAPLYKKWWFWALTAAVVGGTAAFGAATYKPLGHSAQACPLNTLVCFGDGRPSL